MNQAAAIKRASQQARNAMYALDDATAANLLLIYEQAAQDVRARIAMAADGAGNVPTHKLRELLGQIEAVIDGLTDKRNTVLTGAIEQAATLGVRPFTAQGVLAVGGADAVLTSSAAMRVHEQAVRFVVDFVQADGLTLSDRLWRLDKGAKEALTRQIGLAVVQGQSATQAARDFVMRGEAIPRDVAQRVVRGQAPALASSADMLKNANGGDGYWQAERVMRTEINRAHGEAYMAAGQGTPGFAGWRYLLSPAHPKPDICFRAGTLVTTRRGPVPIEQVKVGDVALTHLGRWRPVIRLYRSASGQSGLVRLCFPGAHSRTQPVVMTPNHPVLTPTGWTAAGDLQTGCPVVCLGAAAALPPAPHGAGASHTASANFAQTALASAAQKNGPEQCDAHGQQSHRTPRTAGAGAFWPTGLPMFGAAMRLLTCCRRSILGCLPAFAGQTSKAEMLRCAQTSLGGACQSSGYQRPSWAGRLYSSISAFCCSPLAQTILHTPSRLAACWRVPVHNIGLCSTHWPGFQLSSAARGMFPGNLGKSFEPANRAPSTPWHKRDCKTALLPCAYPAPTDRGLVARAWRIVHRFLVQSWRKNNLFTTQHPIIEKLAPTGETVFNLEVADDHSYVANGLVVHNCDLLASQNLHGLGAGVYPSRDATPWPAHPNTLSFLNIVFESDVTDADRAGKETSLQALKRLPEDKRQGALGVSKAAYFDQGLLTKGMIRSPLRAVEQRLQRQGAL